MGNGHCHTAQWPSGRVGTRREIEEKKESVVMSSSSSSSSREWTPEEEGKGGGEEGNAQKRGGRRLVWLPVTALVATGVCYAIMYGFFFRSDKDPEEEQPDVAYISEVGDYPPQSCFFTLGCSLLGAAHIAAFVALATETQARLSVAVRSLPPSQAPLLARYVSSSTRMFWAGIIAGMGFMVTGSFQEVHVPTVHIIGALAVFVASIWYGCEAILHSRWRRKLGLDRGDVSAASAPSASSCQSCITTVLDNTLRSPGFIRAWRYVFQGVSIAGLLLLVGAIAIDRNTGSNDAAEPMERSIWAPIGEIVMVRHTSHTTHHTPHTTHHTLHCTQTYVL